MRIALCGRNLEYLSKILQNYPAIEIVDSNPELVISYGGDGSLLGAERLFPGILKLPLRDCVTSRKCSSHSEKTIIEALLAGELRKDSLLKLKASHADQQPIYGLNDIMIHTNNLVSAVRYRLWIDGELHNRQIIGDGLVAATPFGSTGYYQSITHSLFRVGIGLAFNNCTEPLDHLVIKENSISKIEILRGPAVMCADNSPQRIELNEGDIITIEAVKKPTEMLGLDIFRCNDCALIRHQELY